MQRREFMSAVGVAVGAAVVGARACVQPAESPAPSKPKRTLRKAVGIGMVQVEAGVPLVDRFRILKDCGFDGVEMDCPSKFTADDILAAQDTTGIKAHGLVDSKHWSMCLNAPDEKVQAQGIEALETCLRDGKKCGSTSVLLVPGVVNKSLPYDECWRLSQENIRKVLPLAASAGSGSRSRTSGTASC